MTTANVLVSTVLLGRNRRPGETLSADEWDRLTPSVRGPLVRQGIISVRPVKDAPLSPAELDAVGVVEAAQDELSNCRALASALKAQLSEKRDLQRQMTAERRTLTAAASLTDEDAARLDVLRQDAAKLAIEVDDLVAAVSSACDAEAEAHAALGRAERNRNNAEAQRIAEQRVAVASKIEQQAKRLGVLLKEYEVLGLQVASLTGWTGVQLTSNWRVESVLRDQLMLGGPDTGQHVQDLKLLESRVLDDILKRSFADA